MKLLLLFIITVTTIQKSYSRELVAKNGYLVLKENGDNYKVCKNGIGVLNAEKDLMCVRQDSGVFCIYILPKKIDNRISAYLKKRFVLVVDGPASEYWINFSCSFSFQEKQNILIKLVDLPNGGGTGELIYNWKINTTITKNKAWPTLAGVKIFSELSKMNPRANQ